MRTTPLLILLFATLIACETKSVFTSPEQSDNNGPKNGEWITRRADNSIKTRIYYHNGIKNGPSTLYYDDGKTPQLVMEYVNGQRHGTSRKYFQNGKLYAETNYQDDKLHGVRKTFYRSGQLQSILTYEYGEPYSDLKEYYQSGNEKEIPALKYERFGNTLRISVDAELCKSPEFFIGQMNDGEPFPGIGQLTYLPVKQNMALIDLAVFTPSYLALQDIICKGKSSQGNPMVLKVRPKF